MAELRWILAGLGALAIVAIWWWSARRTGQAPGNAELRESTAAPPHTFGAGATTAGAEPHGAELRVHATETRDWGVPPFEPLSIRTADLERVPELEEPMLADPDSLDPSIDVDTMPAIEMQEPMMAAPAPAPARASWGAAPEPGDRSTAATPETPNASESQRIIAVRVCAVGEARWPGRALMAALEMHGLAFGRYQVYHRKHSDGRSVFCVASLIEPGTFEIAHMADEEFRGVTLFAVLPGPLEPVQTVDALLATARDLARELSGVVQDSKGLPFSPQRATALREDVARFQATLT